jgi:pyruvate, water dikinase
LKIFNFLKRKKAPGADVGEDVFKKKYLSFKELLDGNNAALEIMSRLETVSEGDFVFDMQYIRSKSEAILEKCQEVITALNVLSNNRYAGLIPIYEGIKSNIEHEVAARSVQTKEAWVLPLSSVDRRFLLEVGGKNANLGEVKNRLQLPTPDGFVLTAEAYRQVLVENHLEPKLVEFFQEVNPDNLEELTQKSRFMREQILQANIPGRLREEVSQHYERLTETLGYAPRLALRSSGLYEDQQFSFAGQFLTKLNVPLEQFFPAYLEVLASQFSTTALVYLAQKGLAHRELAMSVGALAMVPARTAGVMFTEDPTGSQDGQIVIDAAWGLGPTVVEGTLVPDRFILAKKPEIALVEEHISPKPFRLIAAAGSQGLQKEAVPDTENAQPALTQEELLKLGCYGLRLEEYFGEPQDVEFAVDAQGSLLILQSRPLTVSRPQAEALSCPLVRDHALLIDHGTVACFGVAAGPAFVINSDDDLVRFPEGAVLVARHTSARYGAVFHKAAAMVVDIGSATAHLAILAREFKIPALVDTAIATQVIKTGEEITVDADSLRVYQGRVEELLRSPAPKPHLLTEMPLYLTLHRVLRWITPLNLTDPKLSDLTPESCQTLHDIIRFAHQVGIAEMFELGEQARHEEAYMVRLKTTIPLNLYLIDLGGGIEVHRRAPFVSPEAITSVPMKALWKGITHPEVSWAGPVTMDAKGLYSVFTRSLSAPAAQHSDFWIRTLAIVSRNYLNFSSRLGYHFATIDAYMGEVRNDNYISFRFKGGAANEHRRVLRARFLGNVMEKLDFEVEIIGDLIVAKLWKYPMHLMEEKLDLIGRLMACSRQKDMVMGDERLVDWYTQAFLEGNYRFIGEPL